MGNAIPAEGALSYIRIEGAAGVTLIERQDQPSQSAHAFRGTARLGCEVIEALCFRGDEEGALGEDRLAEDAA